ncbi:hypothetical protein D9615_005073 [Tricholomella constricta]|uniref:Uncharacterized protein n=1 Tax=Tricholomella constricta TaxID=117010 RepID=A0A8H5M731_9AGAR|nr:hypothetical protein D9615_005073 [Tricholomella constricta]
MIHKLGHARPNTTTMVHQLATPRLTSSFNFNNDLSSTAAFNSSLLPISILSFCSVVVLLSFGSSSVYFRWATLHELHFLLQPLRHTLFSSSPMNRYSFTQYGHGASSSSASHLPIASSSQMHMTGDGYYDIDPSAKPGSWNDNQSEGPTAYPNTADSAPFYHNSNYLYPTKSLTGPGAIMPPLRSSRIQPAPSSGVMVMPPSHSHGPQGEPHQNPVAAITIEEQHNVAADGGSAVPPPSTSTLPTLKWRAAWVCQSHNSLPVPTPRTSEHKTSKRRERKQRASDEVADASSSNNATTMSEEPGMLKFVNLVDQLHSKNVRTQTKQGTLTSQWRCDRCQVNYANKFALTRHQLKCAPKDKIIENVGSAAVESQGNKRKTPHTLTVENNTAGLSVTKKARKGKRRKAEEVSGQAGPIQRGVPLPAAEFSFRMSRPSSQATEATSQNNNPLVHFHEPHVSGEIRRFVSADQANHPQAPMPIQPPHMSISYDPNSQLSGLHQDVANWSNSARPAHSGAFISYARPEYGPPQVLVGRRTQAHYGWVQNQVYLGPSHEPGNSSQYTQSSHGDQHYVVTAIPSGHAQNVMQPIDGYSSSTMHGPLYPFDGQMQACYPYQHPALNSGGDHASSYNSYYHQHNKFTYDNELALNGYPDIVAPTLAHTQTFEPLLPQDTYPPDILPLGSHAQAWHVEPETTFQPIESFGLPATHVQQAEIQDAQTSASSVSQGSGMPDQEAHVLSDDNDFDDEFTEPGSSPLKEVEIIAIEEPQVSSLVPEAPITNVDDESDDEFGDLFTERGSSPLKQVEDKPPRATSEVAGESSPRRLKRQTSSSNLF